jgi:hypothetical protein
MTKAKSQPPKQAYAAPTQPMEDVDVELIISRTTGGLDVEKSIRIEITDKLSHTRIADIAMTPVEFVEALFSRYASGTAHIYVGAPWGLKVEHTKKMVWVPGGDYATRKDRARACLEANETDGWIGDWRDVCNVHNRREYDVVKNGIKGDVYVVGFTRYVPAEPVEQTLSGRV